MNIKFLHTPQTEQRELAYRKAQIVDENKAAVPGIVAVNIVWAVLIIVVVLCFLGPHVWGQENTRKADDIIRTMKVIDRNGDGKPGRVDCSLCTSAIQRSSALYTFDDVRRPAQGGGVSSP
jgi:hypothetical protein